MTGNIVDGTDWGGGGEGFEYVHIYDTGFYSASADFSGGSDASDDEAGSGPSSL